MCRERKCIFLCLFVIIYPSLKLAWGQKSYIIDRLEVALNNAQEDTNKILLYHQLLEQYTISGAEKLQDFASIADAYFTLSITYTDGLKQYDMAIFYGLEALRIYEKLNHQDGKANTCNIIAWVYGITNQHLSLAHDYIDKAIGIAQSTREKKFLAYYWGTKGLIYKTENQLDSAIFYFQKANQNLENINDKAIIAYFNTFLGDIYFQQANNEKAFSFYLQAVQYSKQAEAKDFLKGGNERTSRSRKYH